MSSTIPAQGAPLPTGQDKTLAVREMFDTIASRYDLVNRLMTLGMDRRWRHRAIDSLSVGRGATVLDLACGTGDMAQELRRRGVSAVGTDLSLGMLGAAPEAFPRAQCDAADLPIGTGSLDGVTCGFALRNFTDLPAVTRELARVVRPGGRIALLDVAEPPNPLMQLGHSIYFNRVVPLIGGLLSDADAYAYLPRSVAYLPPTRELLEIVRRSGFDDITRTLLSGGITQLISARRAR